MADSPEFLAVANLTDKVGSATVAQLLDFDGNGEIEGPRTQAILAEAEGEATSRMLRSYSLDEIKILAKNDPVFMGHCAWVALELASESKKEFLSPEGKGQYWTQYDRALKYFDNLSKGKQRSRGEKKVGLGANSGGKVQPSKESLNGQSRHVFASSKDDPVGPGGF